MLERRNSDRLPLNLFVSEANGDYLYSYKAINLSEEGIFLEGKFRLPHQEAFSEITFTLPNGVRLAKLTARMVREEQKGPHKGAAFEFLNLDENARMELKRYIIANSLRGSA